ncbi:MAG: DoxX family membrane protein [Oligoflexus sp.]
MKKLTASIRYVLGVFLLLMGANKFFAFMPSPEMPAAATEFMTALLQSGYIMPMVGIVEIVSGILFLSSRTTPLANLILAPLSVNIILFHLVLAPADILPALLVAAANVYLIIRYFEVYQPIFGVMKVHTEESFDNKEALHRHLKVVS